MCKALCKMVRVKKKKKKDGEGVCLREAERRVEEGGRGAEGRFLAHK